MSDFQTRRNIDEKTIKKVVSELSSDFKYSLPGDPILIAQRYARRRVHPFISPSINDNLRKMMFEHILPDEDYLKVLYKIMAFTFNNKSRACNPSAHILLSQTGGGKSNLREKILRDNAGIVVIDSDSYKKFRDDSMQIQEQYPQYYGALTGIDCYDHVENISRFTMEQRYNFLIESAPSVSQGVIGINMEELNQLAYNINYDALAIGDIISQMAVHKRYEQALRDDKLKYVAKLTDIDRHNDSYAAVVLVLQNSSEDSKILIFRRGTDLEGRVPQLIEAGDGKEEKIVALEEYRRSSNEDYITSGQFKTDYKWVKRMMEERKAPEIQREQLNTVVQNATLRFPQISNEQNFLFEKNEHGIAIDD